MKKLILMLAIVVLAATTIFGQDLYVIEKSLPSDLDRQTTTFLNKIKGQVTRIEREMNQYKKNMDIGLDTIYNESLIDAYVSQVNNLYSLAKNQFVVDDTTQVTKIGESYYLEGSEISIDTEILSLQDRYNRLVSIYTAAEVVKMNEGLALKNRYFTLINFKNQIQELINQ